jgi:hypothetical protein
LNRLAEPFGSRHRLTWLVGAIALATCALLGLAAHARAAETVYWINHDSTPPTIGFANADGTGSGGGSLGTGAVTLGSPEGLAYDPANGRVYIADASKEQIDWVATDGSGGGVLDTSGAAVEDPRGIAVDPATQTVYWANDEDQGSIGFASANGGGGGTLNSTGVAVEDPVQIALDTTDGRVYWANPHAVHFLDLNDSGGQTLAYGPNEGPAEWSGLSVDPAAGRLYLLGKSPAGVEGIYWLNLSGVGGGEVPVSAGPSNYVGPSGLAFDPHAGRFIWANLGAGTQATKALSTYAAPAPFAYPLFVGSAPVDGPQDPIVVESPVGLGAPSVSASGASLSCSQGVWSQDYPGSYFYGAPVSYAYQWSKENQPIPGATGPTLQPTQYGSYSCAVTGTNSAGSQIQVSGQYLDPIAPPPIPANPVVPAKVELVQNGKKRVEAVAGQTVALAPFEVWNYGEESSRPFKVCAKLNKEAEKGLVAPECVKVAALAPYAKQKVTMKVKTKPTAEGSYSVSVGVEGPDAGHTHLTEVIEATPKSGQASSKHGKSKHPKNGHAKPKHGKHGGR